jgi:hypothetical protein
LDDAMIDRAMLSLAKIGRTPDQARAIMDGLMRDREGYDTLIFSANDCTSPLNGSKPGAVIVDELDEADLVTQRKVSYSVELADGGVPIIDAEKLHRWITAHIWTVAEMRAFESLPASGGKGGGSTQTVRQLNTTEEAKRLTIDQLGALEIVGGFFAEHLPGPTRMYLERSAEWRRVGEGWFRRHYTYED